MNRCVCLYNNKEIWIPNFLDKQLEVAYWDSCIVNINVNVNVIEREGCSSSSSLYRHTHFIYIIICILIILHTDNIAY